MAIPALRVVGPPGSGKSLLITALVEGLRQRGHRAAVAERREGTDVTVVTLPNGARATLERAYALERVRTVVGSLDPGIDLVIAEAFEDAGHPSLVVVQGAGEAPGEADADALASVPSERIAEAFAAGGPGALPNIAELVEERLLGGVAGASGGTREDEGGSFLGRLRRGLRGGRG